MKYQATVAIEFEAQDVYVESSERRRLKTLLDRIREEFPAADLSIRRRRPRSAPRTRPPERLGEGFEVVRVRYVP